jgi:acyl-coenzyme A synthetase/AMP-(fatty) acid ligase
VPGAETLRYSELLALTDAVAARLHSLDPGDLLAVRCTNSYAYVALIFAVAKLRLSYVPVMSNFTSAQVDEVARMGPRLYVHDAESAVPDRWRDRAVALESLTGERAVTGADLPSCASSRLPPETFRVMWSSGSTGPSKPIIWRQDTLAAERLRWNVYVGFSHEDVFLCLHTLDVAHATDLHLFSSVAAGAHLILLPEAGDTRQVVGLVEKYAVTALSALPTHYREIIDRFGDEVSTPQRLATITCAMSGGAMTTDQLLSDAYEMLGLEIREIYGSTEFGLAMIAPPATGGRRQELLPVSGVGVALRGNENPGEIELDSMLTADEYWRRNEDSRKTFAQGVFRAGDLALRSEIGGYRVLGRASDYFVNDDATPVNLFEVDECLRKRYSTSEIFSIQEEDIATGQSRVRTYVGADGPDDATIRSALLTEGLTGDIVVVRVSRIPRTPVGKYDKGALSAQRGFETPHGPVRYEFGSGDDHGRSIVMIPGLGFGAQVFERLAESLAGIARIYVLDLPGHGEYTQSSDFTLASYVAIVRDFLRTLGSDDITLLGWSLGATAVWEILQADYPVDNELSVSGVVIVEQSPCLVLDENWPHAAFGQLSADTAADTRRAILTDPSDFVDRLITQSVYPRGRAILDDNVSDAGELSTRRR